MYFKQFEDAKSIHISDWPSALKISGEEIEQAGNLAVKVIGLVRKYKSENKMSLKEELAKVKIICSNDEKKLIELVVSDIKSTAKIKEVKFVEGSFSVEF